MARDLAERARHEGLMRRALAEAEKGVGRTSPNPAVGAVVARNGRVIAVGHHAKAGGPHAEVVALGRAGGRARGADLYTTLEPCNHHGRTPPCSQAILAAGIQRVFCASADPNPLVDGKGVAWLRKAGVHVTEGLLRAEADTLNGPFFKYLRARMPWVTLKAAVSLDGQMAASDGSARWVTGPEARAFGHRLRDRHDAVLVGAGTVAQDDPRLTTRLPGGAGRDAVRVVLDSRLTLPTSHRIFRQRSPARTLVATLKGAGAAKARALVRLGVEVWTLPAKDGRVDVKALLRRMGDAGLRSVLVEGGPRAHATFLRERGAVDAIFLFLAPKLLGAAGFPWTGDLRIPTMHRALPLQIVRTEPLGDDLLIEARPAARP